MTEPAPTLVIGLAGHVDHGKTSLVRALTGTDTDRLEEERRRGLTIELGFAHAMLPSGARVSFVDVPGHERFVRTMAAGVSGIDAAMLVVDARESVRTQTREHADILRILGCDRVLAVINKSDLVDENQLRSVAEDVRELLGPSCCATVACSAKTGAGIPELFEALAALPVAHRSSHRDAPFRMPIDRVFTMRGSGTIVTGTVWQGAIRTGDTLHIAPGTEVIRIRGVQTQGKTVESAGPGQRTALNIVADSSEPERGQELVEPDHFKASHRLTLDFDLLPSAAHPLRSGARVLALVGTGVVPASIRLISQKMLEPGQRAIAQLICGTPLIAVGGQPILIRSGSPEETIGGGVVRSVFAPVLRSADTRWQERLRAIPDADTTRRLEIAAWALGERSWDPAMVFQEAGIWGHEPPGVPFSSGRIEESRLHSLLERVESHIENLSDGGFVEHSRITSAIRNRQKHDVLAAIEYLIEHDRLTGKPTGVALKGHESSLSDADREAIDALISAYEADGVKPRPADQMAQETGLRLNEVRRLIKLASERGELVHLTGVHFVTASVAKKIRAQVRALLREQHQVAVADIRDLLGVTRKHAVPICEYLDRVKVTRRIGNDRVLYDQEQPVEIDHD